jgi:hypothetical protein
MVIVAAGGVVIPPESKLAVAHIPIPWGTIVFVTTTLVMLVVVLLAKLTVLVFVFVGVTVVLPLTSRHTVDGGGCVSELMVVVANAVEVSVLVVRDVESVVEVTIVMYDAGVLAQRGISKATTCALLTLNPAAAFSRGDRCTLARVEVTGAGGMQLSVVVTVEMMFLWMVRAIGVEVVVTVEVLVLAVKVWVPVVQGRVIVAAGRTVSSI